MFDNAGNNPWANNTRGCLKCVRQRGPQNQSQYPMMLTKIYRFSWNYGWQQANGLWDIAGPLRTLFFNQGCYVDEGARTF